jgi:hypothetical protein
LPGGIGKLDRGRVIGRAEIPGKREQHERMIVGVARVIERVAVDRDGMKPAAIGGARGAHQEGDAMLRGLAECRVAAQHVGVAEHIGQARLHQRRAPLIMNRAPVGIECLEEAAGRIGEPLAPERAQVLEQPGPQRARIVGIEQRHSDALPCHAGSVSASMLA